MDHRCIDDDRPEPNVTSRSTIWASVRKAWQLDKWGFWEPLQASAVNGQPTLVLGEE
ncbi:MAG: hypothetical protein GY946_24115 [bacterium]|nr:hypothetical protein [bacterium]